MLKYKVRLNKHKPKKNVMLFYTKRLLYGFNDKVITLLKVYTIK